MQLSSPGPAPKLGLPLWALLPGAAAGEDLQPCPGSKGPGVGRQDTGASRGLSLR